MNILVTGSNGQLAACIKTINPAEGNYNFIYKNSSELDVVNSNAVNDFFKSNSIAYCINCAAYTAVDKAETEKEQAFNVNDIGAENLAKACHENDAKLIHISTDFVFDGTANQPYKETDATNPISIYGASKLAGELKIQRYLEEHFIIRTSWLYSEFGSNFMKTMLRLSKTRNEIGVVSDQIGTPTYALDLAQVILKIVQNDETAYGVYHYSNAGIASWYDFAKSIFEFRSLDMKVNAITTEEFPTPANRPKYSVLDKSKIKNVFKIEIPHWEMSLKKALANYDK